MSDLLDYFDIATLCNVSYDTVVRNRFAVDSTTVLKLPPLFV